MKKSVVVILAVAIIGALGMYSKDHTSTAHSLVSQNTNNSSMMNGNGSQSAMGSSSRMMGYKDGTFTGANQDTPYGPVQIAIIISGGKITDVNFLQMPSDLGHSQEVTSFSEPLLKQTTLQHQNANIDFVSGATSTSAGYQQSLQSALDKAAQTGQNSSTNSNSNNTSSPAPTGSQSVSPYTGSGRGYDE